MLDEVKKQYFEGNQAKFVKGLKDQGYTVDSLREDLRSQVLTEKIYEKLTNELKVTDEDLQKYYDENKSNYTVPESRSVRHILVKTKAEADQLHTELNGGANFAVLAKANPPTPAR